MKAEIMKTGENTYTQSIRGAAMTLTFREELGRWAMYTDNASARAWNRGMPSGKYFRDLSEVEKHYKSWRGIAALVQA